VRTCALAGILAISISFLAAQTPGRVDGLDASSAETVLSASLAESGIGSYSNVQGLQEWVSDYTQFNNHFVQTDRARYDFRLEGSVLWVRMSDLQTLTTDGWAPTSIPAKGAEQKLILQMVDRLNADRRALPPSAPLVADGVPPSPPQAPDPALPAVPPHAAADPPSVRNAPVDHLDPNQPPQLDKAMVFDGNESYRCAEGLCAVKKDMLFGFVDYHGNLALDFQYIQFPASNYIPYFRHGTCLLYFHDARTNRYFCGFIDKKGNRLFGGKGFDSADPFDDVVTRVTVNNQTFFLDLQGNLVRTLGAPREFHDGLAADGDYRGYGFRNSRNQWAIQPTYSNVQDFHDGIAWVEKKSGDASAKWGAIDKTGKEVVAFVFPNAQGSFSDGMALVFCQNPVGFGYVNATGALVIPCQPGVGSPFVHGHAYIRGGHPELIDKQGNAVNGFTGDYSWQDKRPRGTEPREDGMYMFSGDHGSGLLDADWNVVLPAAHYQNGMFPAIGLFSPDDDPDGLAYVTLFQGMKQYRGFINRHGEFILVQQDSKF
jgi:WG repeat protein